MKLQFKKDLPPPPLPKILMTNVRLHVTTEMSLGINQTTGEPFYVMKLEMPTDLNGVQAIMGALQSDGSVVVTVMDGSAQDQD
jgi:hypothetical protein